MALTTELHDQIKRPIVQADTDTTNGFRPEVVVKSGPTGASSSQVQGTAADGAAAVGNPVQAGGVDGSGNAQALLTDTSGRQVVVGAAADGAAAAGNPVQVGGVDPSGNAQAVNVTAGGELSVAGTVTQGDGAANISWGTPLANGVVRVGWITGPLHFNGTSWDRVRNNQEATALASAARTATTNSSDITNHNAVGILVFLNVTVASGTGGLQVQVMAKDPVSGSYFALNAAPTAVTGTGLKLYVVDPGSSGGNATQATEASLPRTFRITVTHGDGSSYTYSVGYALVV